MKNLEIIITVQYVALWMNLNLLQFLSEPYAIVSSGVGSLKKKEQCVKSEEGSHYDIFIVLITPGSNLRELERILNVPNMPT